LEKFIEETFEASNPKEAFELAKRLYKDKKFELVRAKHKIDESGKVVSEITLKVFNKTLDGGLKESKVVEFVSKLLIKKGLDRDWLLNLLSQADDKSILKSEKSILTYVMAELEKNIYIKKERLNKKRVLILIGTTGVGKTTTLAKLAARFAYMLDKEYRVAILNLDNYRAGAYEQLKIFADTLLLDYYSIPSTDEFQYALERLKNFDVVLVDSAGISPKDTDRLIKQIEFLKSIRIEN